jgi:hypothetical protein
MKATEIEGFVSTARGVRRVELSLETSLTKPPPAAPRVRY